MKYFVRLKETLRLKYNSTPNCCYKSIRAQRNVGSEPFRTHTHTHKVPSPDLKTRTSYKVLINVLGKNKLINLIHRLKENI